MNLHTVLYFFKFLHRQSIMCNSPIPEPIW